MSYSIEFYALKEEEFAARLQTQAPALLREMEQQLKSDFEGESDSDEEDEDGEDEDREDDDEEEQGNADTVHAILSAAKRICQNDLPADCGAEYFSAFQRLISLASEHITLCDFQDVRGLSYLEEIGIWPSFQRRTPVFPMPRNLEGYPGIGFLSRHDMAEFASTGIHKLPQPLDSSIASYVENARDELQFVIEGLINDQLDLVAVLI